EHRALVLIGTTAARIVLADRVVEVAQGGALVTDNYFQGLSVSRLVQIPVVSLTDTTSLRFEKLTFANNRCDHTGPGGDASVTADLFANHMIVTSNHVKSPLGSHSIGLGNRPQVALITNYTTGDYFQASSTVPAPIANFNIRV